MEEVSTEDILKMIRSKDLMIWDVIYRKYGRMLKEFVLKNSGSEEEANDQVQETMAAAYVKMNEPNFQLTCEVGTYLYSINRFKWLAVLKRRKLKLTSIVDLGDFEIPDNATESEIVDKEVMFDLVDQYLLHLQEKCQEIIKRYYLLKHKMQQIASDLEYKNAKVAKTQKARCMAKLKGFCNSAL